MIFSFHMYTFIYCSQRSPKSTFQSVTQIVSVLSCSPQWLMLFLFLQYCFCVHTISLVFYYPFHSRSTQVREPKATTIIFWTMPKIQIVFAMKATTCSFNSIVCLFLQHRSKHSHTFYKNYQYTAKFYLYYITSLPYISDKTLWTELKL